MGIARLALAGLAAVVLVTLVVIGARALLSDTERQATPTAQPTATSATQDVPTVSISCVADTCPHVVVRVPGGDVLQNGDMTLGEELRYFEPELDVVIEDGATVQVTENGTPRPPGKPGKREDFTVSR